jgi:hypothetical protein
MTEQKTNTNSNEITWLVAAAVGIAVGLGVYSNLKTTRQEQEIATAYSQGKAVSMDIDKDGKKDYILGNTLYVHDVPFFMPGRYNEKDASSELLLMGLDTSRCNREINASTRNIEILKQTIKDDSVKKAEVIQNMQYVRDAVCKTR